MSEFVSNPDRAADGPGSTRAILAKLAKILDCFPEAFSDPIPSDLSQTTELLRLWNLITDGQDRLKVLAIMQSIAVRA